MLKIPAKIEYVINTLCQNGYEAYIVGGCVRDMLMSKEPHDFDITTSAEPEEIESLFEKTVPTGKKHGTITVLIDTTPIEVTTFRTDGEYVDHRRPDGVRFVKTLKEDLARRDFTVNAMAYSTSSGLIDYFGGANDLKFGLLRAVGDPEKRFNEDALRILRLFRFASVLDFYCEEKTLKAALKYSPTLENISRERVLSELLKAVTGKNIKVFKPLIENGGLGFLNINKSPEFSLFQKLSPNPNLCLFTFLHLSGADTLNTLSLLKASNRQKAYSGSLLKLISRPVPKTKSDLKEMLASSSPEILKDYLLYKSTFDFNTKHLEKMLLDIEENNEPYLISHLKIDGEYLKKLGFAGPVIGEILEHLRKTVIAYPERNNIKALKDEITKIKP